MKFSMTVFEGIGSFFLNIPQKVAKSLDFLIIMHPIFIIMSRRVLITDIFSSESIVSHKMIICLQRISFVFRLAFCAI